MIDLKRTHDFQVFISPKNNETALTNPPSFNWPESETVSNYYLIIENINDQQTWTRGDVHSPLQLNFKFDIGDYRWQVLNDDGDKSNWMYFSIAKDTPDYIAPMASDLFLQCKNKTQWMMYFDEDLKQVVNKTDPSIYHKFVNTAELICDDLDIVYPEHYKRGAEEGKRTAITNVREWVDRDLMASCLLYKIWGKLESGTTAVNRLLKIAQWSTEGPASLLRPCTWGDEVGLSLARNLFLAYHWLAPLLRESEKDFIRPMLIRIAHQMEMRLEQDNFKQFPGHSHTSRLPGYLGVAALVLHKEYDYGTCEKWLNYSLMIYRGIFPFYGGPDGSWAEGAFYSSSYSKWQHPFFLSVERLSGFSFYNHPFYKEYANFAIDFVISEDDIHPFGDGFWCKRDSVEWPGFFSQNPLSIYAERYGDASAILHHEQLKKQIYAYQLHVLDVIPTVSHINYVSQKFLPIKKKSHKNGYNKFYYYAGFGITEYNNLRLFFRASFFGNSSHRHADQGNITLMDQNVGVLVPTGSYGYRFGSSHHSEWTRQTKAHNLPLIDGCGQLIDSESATAELIGSEHNRYWTYHQIDLSKSYEQVNVFNRHLIMIADAGLIIIDDIQLEDALPVQWRLHSQLSATVSNQAVLLDNADLNYICAIQNEDSVIPIVTHGYQEEVSVDAVISDASSDVYHFEWELPARSSHRIVASCLNTDINIALKDNKLVVQNNKMTIVVNLTGDQINIDKQ
jgi:hypothetical protein